MGSQKFPWNPIWISWEKHRRSRSICERLGIPLVQFDSSLPRWVKHPAFVFKTLLLLYKRKPKLVFVQNPSVFLTLTAIVLRPFFGYRLIVDAHNAGVYPFDPNHYKFRFVFPFLHRHADLTIVSNSGLASIVCENGGKAAILPDPLPEFGFLAPRRQRDDRICVVTYVCSYSSDEPFLQVFKAAGQLPDYIRIYVTGNDAKLSYERELAISNKVILTGFLTEEDYVSQLKNSNSIIVLTSFSDCMVCGAYEAVSLGIPLILSDTPALRWWFDKGVIFTDHKVDSLVEAILNMSRNNAIYKEEMIRLRHEMKIRWHKFYLDLLNQISSLINVN